HELVQPALLEPVEVDRLRDLPRTTEAEVLRHDRRESRVGSAPVSRAHRVPQRGRADVAAASPVAGDGPDRREPVGASVRSDTGAVRPLTSDDRDAPGAVGAGASDRVRVVLEDLVAGPAVRTE